MNVTVYLGSSEPRDPTIRDAVVELGTWIGENGHTLIYGGSKSGLMGVLAVSCVEAGGDAIGVEPQFFIDSVLQYEGLTELIATKDMSERKAIMIDKGDAFLAMPGGTGTLEEIAEIISKICLDHLDAPCILYNHNGYYDGLKQLLQNMIDQGLSTETQQAGITFADSIEEIKAILTETARTVQ